MSLKGTILIRSHSMPIHWLKYQGYLYIIAFHVGEIKARYIRKIYTLIVTEFGCGTILDKNTWTYCKFSTKSDILRHTESVLFQYISAENVRNGKAARGHTRPKIRDVLKVFLYMSIMAHSRN